MTDDLYPTHTPVHHKTEGYVGWVHATTRMKEIFTGTSSLPWQYTIRIEGQETLKVAPACDLQWIDTKAPFPAYVMYQETLSEKNFLQETRLHALGYHMSGTSSDERWQILKYVAIPMLGAKEVVRTISAVILSRIARPANADRFRHALKGWSHDLNAIAAHIESMDEAKDVRANIAYVLKKLEESKVLKI